MRPARRLKRSSSLKIYLLELAIYSVMVVVYFYLVLYSVTGLLRDLYLADRKLYAVVSLGLMIVQGVALESITAWILKLIESRTGEGD